MRWPGLCWLLLLLLARVDTIRPELHSPPLENLLAAKLSFARAAAACCLCAKLTLPQPRFFVISTLDFGSLRQNQFAEVSHGSAFILIWGQSRI